MALVQDYVILNQEFRNAQNLLTTREEIYRIQTEETVPNAEREVVIANELKSLILLHTQDLIVAMERMPNSESSLAQTVHNNILMLDSMYELNVPESTLITIQAGTANLIGELAVAREGFEAVEHLAAETIITQERLEEALYATGNIIPDSVEIHDNGRGNALVSWGITGVILTPNENPYQWINDGGPVAIALADVRVEIDLQTNQVYLKVFGEDIYANHPYKYSREFHVHPHVLGHHKPCLGDWSGPVTEAICEQDWATVSGMLTTYLSNANQHDIAGRNWCAGVLADHYSYGEYNKGTDRCIPNDLPFDAAHIIFDADPENPGKFIRTYLDAANQIVDPGRPPHEYEPGDTVKLRESSVYYNPRRTTGTNPAGVEGKFMEYVSERGIRRMRIKWPDGINSYDKADLEWVEEPEHVLPEIIANLPQSDIQFPRSSHDDAMDAARYGNISVDPARGYSDVSIAGRSGFDIVTDIESEVTGRIPGTPSLFD